MLHRTLRAPSVCRAAVATALALSLSFPGVLSGGATDPEATPQAPVRIGLVSSLFRDLPASLPVWMSHGDRITALPPGFRSVAQSQNVRADAP